MAPASQHGGGGKVLWIDPCFDPHRPTAQSLCLALPALLDKGWQMELWCLTHAEMDPRVKMVRLPRARFLRLLEPMWFWFVAWLRLTWLRLKGQQWDVVHTSGPDIPDVDVISLHFHNRSWIGRQWREPKRTWRERLKILHTFSGVIQESLGLAAKRWRVILPVSKGLAKRIDGRVGSDKTIRVQPNVLDSRRFHPGVRGQFRVAARAELQAKEQDFVFIFVSTGHYQRKGLWAALEALNDCREIARQELGIKVRFLVVGAGARAQQSLVPRLDTSFPGWSEWVTLKEPVPDVERWYAASDAFLFPSRYETFSLVALEASACDLPLLVTPYDGQEMYLQDGVNGRLLPWEQDAMTASILQFLRTDRHHIKPGPAGSIGPIEYASALDEVYRQVIASRL